MPDDRNDHDEITRARNRLHSIEKSLLAIEWRLKSVEELLPGLRELLSEDNIARWRRVRRRVALTWTQRVFALVVASVACLPTLEHWIQ